MFPIKDNIPTDRFPVVTVALIVANTIVYFILQRGGILQGAPDLGVIRSGAIPYELTHLGRHCSHLALVAGQTQVLCDGLSVPPGALVLTRPIGHETPTVLTVLTSMFMHGSILHLAGNMLFLWIFGNNVEDSMGRPRFIAYYLVGGIAALALQVAIDPNSTSPTIGASGAIAGVLGGYILLFPRARVITVLTLVFFFTIVELPALAVLGLWFVEQAVFGATNLTDPTGGGGGVAYFAHIGGFLFGLAAIRLFVSHRKRPPPAVALT